MAPFRLLISRQEALSIILDSVGLISGTEERRIEEASSRVLSEDIVAEEDVPSFDRAAMDGYALRAEDTFGASDLSPKTLRLVGVLHAGDSAEHPVARMECIRVATGSPLPQGADAVVMVEFTEEGEGEVSIHRAVYPGGNVAKRGEDIRKGETVLEEGVFLTPARIGALAALGRRVVQVYQKPRVAVIPTGSEVRDIGSKLEGGEVYDVNSYTLSSLLSDNGSLVTRSPIIPDDLGRLRSTVERFLDHDLIVFSGGSSVGERDLLVRVIQETGRILFHGVQIKPGKPTLFGLVEGKPVFGMPGYPTSCLSNAYIFLIPLLRKVARLPPKEAGTVRACMGKRVVSASGREQFLPVKLIDGRASPVFKKSGDITSLAVADGYVILPVNLDVIEEGEEVYVNLFG